MYANDPGSEVFLWENLCLHQTKSETSKAKSVVCSISKQGKYEDYFSRNTVKDYDLQTQSL